MNILATPFVKLWRWIKETAWIQPLLIVGIIFGIIFSIQPFVNWIKGLNSDESATNSYYQRYQKSLEGILGSDYLTKDNSEAGKFMTNLISAQNAEQGSQAQKEAIAKLPSDKFFLTFVQESCSGCQEAKLGFKTLEDNWNKGYYIPKDVDGNELPDQKFSMVTIYCDEDVTNDTDDSKLTGFGRFLDLYSGLGFFEAAAARIENESEYYLQKFVDKTKLGYFRDADVANFQTPTIVLIDFTDTGSNGATEILFNVANEGGTNTDQAKARTLIDCWNRQGDFALKNK